MKPTAVPAYLENAQCRRDVLQPIDKDFSVVKPLAPVVLKMPKPVGPAHRPERYTAGLFAALRRLVFWYGFLIRFKTGSALKDPAARAERLRTMLQEAGVSGVKIGQQLAVRVDLLPHAYADEMSKLLDKAPPMPLETALGVLEASLGKPINEVFYRLDPEPIGSASLACVYRAVLLDGSQVAVKIRRPGVAPQLAADMRALRLLAGFLEGVGLVRRNLIVPAVDELRRMMVEELDFVLESRQMTAFGRDIKDVKHVDVPKVYYQYARPDVLVTEYIQGLSMRDIIDVVESKDLQRLATLAAQGYAPHALCRRWLRFFYWQAYEGVLFHADPHPGNIIARPGNKLVLLDFGALGTITAQTRRNMIGFQKAHATGDLDGLVRYTIAMGEPLPPLDLDAYRAEMRGVMREYYIISRCRHVPWQERAFGRGLQMMGEVTRKYHVGMPPDQLRYLRASNLSDSMVFRLDPETDMSKEFTKWQRRREEKEREALEQNPIDLQDPLTLRRKWDILEKGIDHLNEAVAQSGHSFREQPSKGAYVLSNLLSAACWGLLPLLALTGMLRLLGAGDQLSTLTHLGRVAGHPLGLCWLALTGLPALRKIITRINQHA